MNHFCVLYQSDKQIKNKLAPVDEFLVDNCLALYRRKFNKQPNRIYASVFIDKEFNNIEFVYDESIAPYLLYIGHTQDIDKIHVL